jgi:ribonuclease HII
MDLALKKALNASLTLFPLPNGEYEQELCRNGFVHIAGVDEVGRGPLAGPVVAASVMFHGPVPKGLNDSKKLSAKKREELFDLITSCADFAIALVPATIIDKINIRAATLLAMKQALEGLNKTVDLALIDGNDKPQIACPCLTVIKGDSRIASIAAASIVAKVMRDQLMARLDNVYEGYNFASHAGYGTPQHLEALKKLGPCPEHRKSFAPLKNIFTL